MATLPPQDNYIDAHKNIYSPPFFLFNGHLETIYPALFRKVEAPIFSETRILTPDDDSLEVYIRDQKSNRAVIISHGLEGNAHRPYINGMANACFRQGYDVITWNFRGCGSEINKQLRFYHSGATEDLEVVVRFAFEKGYEEINLIGFSLGGNITLKYLGERKPDDRIKKAVTFSVPMDLHTSCQKISSPSNFIYSRRFLKSLKHKVIRKSKLFSELDITGIEKINSLMLFDDRYTAPLHGFKNAQHYYQECSSVRFVDAISIPTLIINAKNDPFLSPECYPEKLLKNHPYVRFESPAKGGHVGFSGFNKNGLYWSEQRATNFLSDD
jgi:predicted alpha/beta-fold hydrolase